MTQMAISMLLSICCALLLLLEVPCVAFQRPGETVTWVKWDAVDDDQQDDDDDKLDHTADYEPVGEQFYYPPTMPINGEEGWQGYLPTVAGMKGRPHMVTAGKLKGFQTRRLSPHFQMWWKEIVSGSAQDQAQSQGWFVLRLQARSQGWLGWGISTNGAMPGSDMLIAFRDAGGIVRIKDCFAVAHAQPVQDEQDDWELLHASFEKGVMRVMARRRLDTGDTKEDHVIPSGVPAYIVWAHDDRAKLVKHRAGHMGFERLLLRGKVERRLPPGAQQRDVFMPWTPPAHRRTTIVCTSFNLLDDTKTGAGLRGHTIVGMEPIISSKASFEHIHHMHLHVCTNNDEWRRFAAHPHSPCEPPSYTDKGRGCHGVLFTYLPGEGRWVYPPNVGVKIGSGRFDAGYVILEQHFDNPQRAKLPIDRSGVRLWTQRAARADSTRVLNLADPFASASAMRINPGETAELTLLSPASCLSAKLPKEGITLFSSRHHMHMNAQRMVSEIRRKGSAKWEVFHDTQWFQHLMQRSLELDLRVLPGDEIRNRCVFTNPATAKEPLHIGTNTYNEMCMQQANYHPGIFKDGDYLWLAGLRRPGQLWCGGITDIMTYVPGPQSQPLVRWEKVAADSARGKGMLLGDFSAQASYPAGGWRVVL